MFNVCGELGTLLVVRDCVVCTSESWCPFMSYSCIHDCYFFQVCLFFCLITHMYAKLCFVYIYCYLRIPSDSRGIWGALYSNIVHLHSEEKFK
jgi:hypothetical protein